MADRFSYVRQRPVDKVICEKEVLFHKFHTLNIKGTLLRKMGINRKTKFQTYNACMAEGKYEVNGLHYLVLRHHE